MLLGAMVDLSHYEDQPLDFRAAAAGNADSPPVYAVMHKATEGIDFVDGLRAQHMRQAQGAGLLNGVFHYGTKADGVAQANFFLSKIAPSIPVPKDLLLSLDQEYPNHAPPMTLDQARAFLQRIYDVVGKWPVYYAGNLIKEQLPAMVKDPIFSQCPLWICDYEASPTWPTVTWPTWSFWQASDGTRGPRARPTVGLGRVDFSDWNGSLENLRKFWGVATSLSC